MDEKILIVDDSSADMFLIKYILSDYDLACASNGVEAMEIIRNDHSIGMIILDLNMPFMNGFDVLQALREDPVYQDISTLILTNNDEIESEIKGLEMGAADYIRKPLNMEALRKRVEIHDKLRRAMRSLKQQNEELEERLELMREVEERRRTEEKLINDNTELSALLANLKCAQNQLIIQEKMAGIGQLAAGVAHEINNPLGYVMCNYETLGKYIKIFQELVSQYHDLVLQLAANQEVGRKQLEDIMNNEKEKKLEFIMQDVEEMFSESVIGMERIQEIVKAMRVFSRDEHSFDDYDLNEGIKTTLIIARNEIKYTARVETDLGELVRVKANGGQVNQVILNILINAVQAIKEAQEPEGLIKVMTRTEEGHVVCSITDNGGAVPDELAERIFEPFFTTKPSGQGTGLGLSLSRDIIVNMHKGDLYYSCPSGKETTFIFKLPISQDADGFGGVCKE